jgi:competence protein ComEA
VSAAGGPTDAAALARINLARVLVDGEQVVVPDSDDPLPAAPAPGGPGGAGASAAAGAAGPLDLNAATAADLDGLPGIGPVLAGRIVAWRSEHGRFARVEELTEVAGIGDKVFERLRPLVRV